MRLRKIKLAGFKSFVDTTTLNLLGNLVGVVGPNGCGKSNIIDAIVWVMGESSAKHLRGDSLTDVIFNGSKTRNPVGQASVELVFDNSDGKAGGQYASYSEISVKRQITRDVVSTYYLNDTRCRRCDIQEIFLGTGLGPRSYAIIKQNMISRLIDAKPDELRLFIEEAAGISKCRERRKETENRITHTKENISRLSDIRNELAIQLKHLQNQSKTAQKYQDMKKQERQLQSELLALHWKELKVDMKEQEDLVISRENLMEAKLAELRQVENNIEKDRSELVVSNESLNKIQKNCYDIANEISKLEQKIQYGKEFIKTTRQDMSRVQKEIDDAQQSIQQDTSKLEELKSTADTLYPELQSSRDKSDKAYQLLNEHEQEMQGWQTDWDTFNQKVADHTQQKHMYEIRLEHLQNNIDDSIQRRKAIEQEITDLKSDAIENTISEHSENIEKLETEYADITNKFNIKNNALTKLREHIKTLDDQLNNKNRTQQQLENRLLSLKVLQQSLSAKDHESVDNWLKSNGLNGQSRLIQKLDVDPDWAHAVEIVLKNNLQDILLDSDESYLEQLDTLEQGNLGIISMDKISRSAVADSTLSRLSDKINNPKALSVLLDPIYVSDDLNNAKQIRAKLKPNESVITRDGIWLGYGWSRVYRWTDKEKCTLQREHEINELKLRYESIRKELQKEKQELSNRQTSQEMLKQELNSLQATMFQHKEKLSEYRLILTSNQTQQEQIYLMAKKMAEQITDLDQQIKDDEFEKQTTQNQLKNIQNEYKNIEKQREKLLDLQKQHRASLREVRQHWQETHEKNHQIALQLESARTQYTTLEQTIKRNQSQLEHLQKYYKNLENSSNEQQKLLQVNDDEFKRQLNEKIIVEKSLGQSMAKGEHIKSKLSEFEKLRGEHEQKLKELRDLLENARLVMQGSIVRLKTIEEQLIKEQFIPDQEKINHILRQLPQDANTDNWQQHMESLADKIQRLGSINLAAINEFAQLSERSSYLENQNEDLRKALNTLKNAVQKIDKETEERFKKTFNKLNGNLKEKFSQLFSGGNAYLELTSNDLLQTGVTIMARPPGKLNSSIHLLSGGEKALTAIAFVFSIFELNKAPLCILDEVDATLDDSNIGRFSDMLKKMSADMRFIFVTHNKITMEITSQLLGITMHEAGVSRIVSVDVDETTKNAATA